MADLNTDVRYIKGIGEQRAKALGKLGIATLRDLISYFPRAYDDRTQLRRIADLAPGEAAGVAAMVVGRVQHVTLSPDCAQGYGKRYGQDGFLFLVLPVRLKSEG